MPTHRKVIFSPLQPVLTQMLLRLYTAIFSNKASSRVMPGMALPRLRLMVIALHCLSCLPSFILCLLLLLLPLPLRSPLARVVALMPLCLCLAPMCPSRPFLSLSLTA